MNKMRLHTGQGPGRRASAAAQRAAGYGDQLLSELSARVGLLTDLWQTPEDRAAARDGLAGFCTDRLLVYLLATDRALYRPVTHDEDSRVLVAALRRTHQQCAAHVTELEQAGGPEEIIGAAHALIADLALTRYLEDDLLLPILAARCGGMNLTRLVEDLEALLPASVSRPPPPGR